MIQIHPYSQANHYALISSWWEGHNWSPMPAHKLPPFGFIACNDEIPIAGAFAYLDNGGTGVAMLEWSVGNPEANPRKLLLSIKALITFMIEELNKIGYDVVFTSCKVEGLIKIYEKCGFQKTDSGMTHLVNITESE